MTDTLRSTLTALSQQWRERAASFKSMGHKQNWMEGHGCETCAKELDAILASLPPEPHREQE